MVATGCFVTGCAARKPVGVDMIIPKEAITGAIRLSGCDSDSPPHCRHSVIPYRKGAEELVISK
jgi:hypothetical protein